MKLKSILTEVISEGISCGALNIRFPIYTKEEIANIISSFKSTFGLENVLWLRPNPNSYIEVNSELTDWLTVNTLMMSSYGVGCFDVTLEGDGKKRQEQLRDFFYFRNRIRDLTNEIMNTPVGLTSGTAPYVYDHREVIFRDVNNNITARFILITPNAGYPLATKGSWLAPAAESTGYSFVSTPLSWGCFGRLEGVFFRVPYLVTDGDEVIGWGIHGNILHGDYDSYVNYESLADTTSATGYKGLNYIPDLIKNYFLTTAPIIDEGAYGGITPSIQAGSDGTYDFTSTDNIEFPSVPDASAVSTGFISLWSPTNEQLLNLAQYMWNADFLTVDFWKKIFANPLDLIYGLTIIPVDLRQESFDIIDGQGIVTIGLVSTGVLLDKIKTQWLTIDCGELTINETWGAYLDYDPYTKLEIYLPFCGTHPLKVDDFMPGAISVTYNIDLLSGACVALVKSTKTDKHGDVLNSVVYQFMGNCATQIPVTAQQFADAIRSAISIAASIGTMVASGVGGAAASNMIHSGASAVENVMNLKPSIERSGAIGSSASLLAVRTPYIILTRPRQARPENQNIYTGYPSFITETLSEISGWSIIQAIHLDNISCTADELDEIDSLLKGGVIL